MIPKIIHYCWFGGKPLPKSAQKCIASWRKYLPDYEIKEWNESNFDIRCCAYVSEAYDAKKYAFVSDYVRFFALNNEGGLYFDTDVEIIKPIDDIIERGPFLGIEEQNRSTGTTYGVDMGLGMGCMSNNYLLINLLNTYNKMHFVKEDGTLNLVTIVDNVTSLLETDGFVYEDRIQECCGFIIYPHDYFSPKDMVSRRITLTSNTRSIHHYDATWHKWYIRKDQSFKDMTGIDYPVFSQLHRLMKFLRIVKE